MEIIKDNEEKELNAVKLCNDIFIQIANGGH